jgi:hypothetical protein
VPRLGVLLNSGRLSNSVLVFSAASCTFIWQQTSSTLEFLSRETATDQFEPMAITVCGCRYQTSKIENRPPRSS